MKSIILATALVSPLLMFGCSYNNDSSDSESQAPVKILEEVSISFISVLIPRSIADEIRGYEATITVVGNGNTFSAKITSDNPQAIFEDLVVGDYKVSIIIANNNIYVGGESKSVTLTKDGAEVYIDINLDLGLLAVNPILKENYDSAKGYYIGLFTVAECLETHSISSIKVGVMTFEIEDGEVLIDIEVSKENHNTQFTGTQDGSSGWSGGYITTDTEIDEEVDSGTWNFKEIFIPNEGGINIKLDHISMDGEICMTSNYVGLK